MTHREYTLTVEKTIYEHLDANTKAVHLEEGETLTLNQQDFDRIKEGQDIVRSVNAGQGMYASVTFNKDNFTNEVTYTEVTVTTGVAKLGKRKPKQDSRTRGTSVIGQEFALEIEGEPVLYALDLESLSPVEVRVKDITGDKVIVEYLNSTPGRTEVFSIEEFEYLAGIQIN